MPAPDVGPGRFVLALVVGMHPEGTEEGGGIEVPEKTQRKGDDGYEPAPIRIANPEGAMLLCYVCFPQDYEDVACDFLFLH
jgi:hypothetical protein